MLTLVGFALIYAFIKDVNVYYMPAPHGIRSHKGCKCVLYADSCGIRSHKGCKCVLYADSCGVCSHNESKEETSDCYIHCTSLDMVACGQVTWALGSRSKGLGFNFHCWLCVEVTGVGKLVIPCCLCSPSSNGYLVERRGVGGTQTFSDWLLTAENVLNSLLRRWYCEGACSNARGVNWTVH